MTEQIRRCAQHATIYATLRQEQLHDTLAQVLGDYRWSVDLGTQRFTFASGTGTVEATAHLLASIAADPATIRWGHAASFGSYGSAVALAEEVRETGRRHRLDQLVDEDVPYRTPPGADQGDVIAALAHDVGALGVELLGPTYCYYSMPVGGASRAVLLLGDLSHPLPPVTLDDVLARLPRQLSQIDDPAWSLDGLARLLPGWSVTHDADGTGGHQVRVVDDAGRAATVGYRIDDFGRVTRLSLHRDAAPGS